MLKDVLLIVCLVKMLHSVMFANQDSQLIQKEYVYHAFQIVDNVLELTKQSV